MDVNAYFNRINYKGDTDASLRTLKNLQEAHLLNLPFENLDIHYGIPIKLNIDAIFNKLIHNNRGGFCYELNGLFFELLQHIGFDAKRVSARVYDPEKGYGKEFDHLTIIVKIKNIEYLTDVGFGDFALSPIPVEVGKTEVSDQFRLEKIENDYLCVFKNDQSENLPKYIFKKTAYPLEAFAEMCHYHQTSPESYFTQQKLISKLTETGRITLSSSKLKILEDNTAHEKRIENHTDFEEKLWEYFKIKMPQINLE